MTAFEVADRVRVIATGEPGFVAGLVLTDDQPVAYDVLLDRQLPPLTLTFDAEELEHYDGPPAVTAPAPARPGLPAVGDALLGLATVLGAQLPDNPEVLAKLAELKAAVESAMPQTEIRDDAGNGWPLCAPGCDLAVVETGKALCSGVVCRR